MFKITSIGGKPNSYSQKEYLLTDISDEDLKIIKLHIIAFYKLDFFNDSATTFNFTKLLSPEIIFDRN